MVVSQSKWSKLSSSAEVFRNEPATCIMYMTGFQLYNVSEKKGRTCSVQLVFGPEEHLQADAGVIRQQRGNKGQKGFKVAIMWHIMLSNLNETACDELKRRDHLKENVWPLR